MAVLEVGDDGVLHVPSQLLPGAQAHSRFEVDTVGNVTVLRPAGAARPFWRQSTPAERAEAFRRWVETPRPSAPDLAPEYLRREGIYH
jgi:hypothetical protein